MVSLTGMLVLYTLFQGISTEIPTTAYLKWLDVWLIYTLVFPFGVFIIQFVWAIWPVEKESISFMKVGDATHISRIKMDDKVRKVFKRGCQIIVPVFHVMFLIIYALTISGSGV